jgi:hypothetical protein
MKSWRSDFGNPREQANERSHISLRHIGDRNVPDVIGIPGGIRLQFISVKYRFER